jgi:hypothetical protein
MPPSAKPERATPAVIRAGDTETKVDSMDVVLGVVWAIVIPVGMYILLSAAGMPPGGGSRAGSLEEQFARKDAIEAVQAPVTFGEIDMRLGRVDQLLQDRVPLFLGRAKGLEDNRVKYGWQELAFRVLGVCRAELTQIQSSLAKNPEFRNRPDVDQGIRRRLSHIETQETEIIRESPFPDRMRAAQAESAARATSP